MAGKILRILLGLVIFSFGISKGYADQVCGEEYICHEGLIKFSRHLSQGQIRQRLQGAGAEIIDYYPIANLYRIYFHGSQDTLQQITDFWAQGMVLVASPNYIVHATVLPNDEDFDLLWGLENTGQTGGTVGHDIGMDEVWDQFTDGSGVIVAVIDSGVDYDHEDLQANMWVNPGEIPDNGLDDDMNGFVDDVHGYDFRNNDGDPMDDHKHGTHVAGTIGAVGNNAIGVAGVNWTAKIMAVKFLSSSASGTLADAVAGIDYAVANGAKILNNSWGSSTFNAALLDAIYSSDEMGVLFFAAAGNQGRDTDPSPFYPASYDVHNIISMAAVTRFDDLWSSSNYGATTVDLGAPGVSIWSTIPGDSYGFISGTSMATPHAAGAAALLWTQFPGLNHRQIRNLIFQSVDPKDYMDGKSVTGGILNVPNAVAIASNPGNNPPVANAGPDQENELGVEIELNGMATDDDGDFPLIFEWELTAPVGSNSTLSDPLIPNPTFVPDMEGTYTAQLIVSDSLDSSLPDTVDITIQGGVIPPPQLVIKVTTQNPDSGQIVELVPGASVEIDQPVFLNASDTTSLFPQNLLFQWSWIATPESSQVTVSGLSDPTLNFRPDVAGTYTLRLVVEDGFGESQAEVSVTAVDTSGPVEPPADPNGPQPNALSAGGCSLHKN